MIKCIAVDDEPLALKQIVSYIDKTPFLELVAKFESPFVALEYLQTTPVDLLFLDIEMPHLNGIDFIKSLENPPMVIFTTAYSEFAIDGFKADAVDYLLKPIGYPDFLKSVNKANTWFGLSKSGSVVSKEDAGYLFVKSEYKIVRINFQQIKYIEAQSAYIKIYLDDSEPVMSLMNLKTIEEQLPSNMFMRVHRSFIVNLKKITTIERSRIVFDGKVYIPVSDQYKNHFQQFIDRTFIN